MGHAMKVSIEDSALAALWRDVDPWEWLVGEAANVEPHRIATGRRTFRFEHAGRGYFAKLHTGVGWRELLKNFASLRLPVFDASNEVEAAQRLGRAGVPTVRVAAYGIGGELAPRRRSFVVLDEVVARGELRATLRALDPRDHSIRREYVRQAARIVRAMHAAGVNHRDLYLVHFLVGADTEAPLTLIDLHRAQCRAEVPRRWRDKDLGGLAFDADELGLRRTDRLRFAREYDPDGVVHWAGALARADALARERERRGARFEK